MIDIFRRDSNANGHRSGHAFLCDFGPIIYEFEGRACCVGGLWDRTSVSFSAEQLRTLTEFLVAQPAVSPYGEPAEASVAFLKVGSISRKRQPLDPSGTSTEYPCFAMTLKAF